MVPILYAGGGTSLSSCRARVDHTSMIVPQQWKKYFYTYLWVTGSLEAVWSLRPPLWTHHTPKWPLKQSASTLETRSRPSGDMITEVLVVTMSPTSIKGVVTISNWLGYHNAPVWEQLPWKAGYIKNSI